MADQITRLAETANWLAQQTWSDPSPSGAVPIDRYRNLVWHEREICRRLPAHLRTVIRESDVYFGAEIDEWFLHANHESGITYAGTITGEMKPTEALQQMVSELAAAIALRASAQC